MDAVLERILKTYRLLNKGSVALSDEGLEKLNAYLAMLSEGGERDPHRLTVCGLTYLRQLDGSSDSVKAGYTGL